ncbi:hypothetical protein MtrunA17_Chr1g0199351 [Medicago truncatula]|uniref:Uncharacterized protein n=1 Tax=Medicago truncatula TaxID=3880 RepID=A0A396JXB4_MEDTR|nr:hypothetical protein MtrunA17_Chr1g0199351 [Medicago truncatula]
MTAPKYKQKNPSLSHVHTIPTKNQTSSPETSSSPSIIVAVDQENQINNLISATHNPHHQCSSHHCPRHRNPPPSCF